MTKKPKPHALMRRHSSHSRDRSAWLQFVCWPLHFQPMQCHPYSNGIASPVSLQYAHLVLSLEKEVGQTHRVHWVCWSLVCSVLHVMERPQGKMPSSDPAETWLPPPKVSGRLCSPLQEAPEDFCIFSSSHSSLDQHSSGNRGCARRRCCQVCLCSGVIPWAGDYMDA